ncbi:3-hydroxyacyl-ACP dehydratase [Flavobacterium sp. J372]|uniref:3-hydroxyacyl-ACP dehydratase n=1 Tax=Flavobacterium sp. J372 TaxID=2898436 RepID=UPI00215125F2|nr:3-hydroxyacyl-ACP dehydratase [Flavobacterium sp. J372]MCR5861382.1 3-hydroxyacyl-ACP dehydratase [Flavobacterium sp. J372]
MSLLNNFYKVQELTAGENGNHIAMVMLNAQHDIFKGHFPGNPVTPGVCMMQIIKELTQQITGEKLMMKQATNVKFMALINPEKTPELKIELDVKDMGDTVSVKNTTCFGDTVALKLSCNFSKN